MEALRLLSSDFTKYFMTDQAIERRELKHALECIYEAQHDEAIAILQRAIDSDTNNHLFYQLRGLIYTLQSKHDKAIADFSGAISLGDISSHAHRGESWGKLHEYERAIEDFSTAITVNPDAEVYSARGDAYMEVGKYHAAIDDYEWVVTLRPDADAYAARGTAYHALKQFDKAIGDFNNATLLDPSNTKAAVMRGNIYLHQGNYGTAMDEFSQIIVLMAEIVDFEGLDFADSEAKAQLYELAIEEVGNAYCARAVCRSRTEDIDGALDDFSAAIKLIPRNPKFYCLRAFSYAEMGERSKAMRDLHIATEIDGRSAIPLVVRAICYFNGGEFEKVLQDSRRAIELNPNWAEAYCIRGVALMHLRNYNKAISDFEKAIELEKRLVNSEPNFGGVSISLGLSGSATHAHRGLAYLLLHNDAMGIKDLSKALDLGYTQAEIEKDLAGLIPEEKDRIAIADVVRSVVADWRRKASRQSQASDRKQPDGGSSAVERTKSFVRELRENYSSKRIPRKMRLISGGNVISDQPDDATVRTAIHSLLRGGGSFVSLVSGPDPDRSEHFIEAFYGIEDGTSGFILQLREGSTGNKCLSISPGQKGLEEVLRAFSGYLHGDKDWDRHFDWRTLGSTVRGW